MQVGGDQRGVDVVGELGGRVHLGGARRDLVVGEWDTAKVGEALAAKLDEQLQ